MDELDGKAVFLELLRVEALDEETALVAMKLELDEEESFDREWGDFHETLILGCRSMKLKHSILLAVVASLFAVSFFHPVFETTDDIFMLLQTAGMGSAPPTDFLLFSHFLIGKTLKAAYLGYPDIPWYPLYLTGLNMFGLIGIGYALLLSRPRSAVWAALLLDLSVGCFSLVMLQFTTTAFVCSLGGMALIFATRKEENRPAVLVFGIFLFILGGMVRLQSAELAAALFIPFWFQNHSWRPLLAGMIGFACVAGLHFAQVRHFESDPSWRQYPAANKVKSKLVDYRLPPEGKEVLNAIGSQGWEFDDLKLARMFFIPDPNWFSVEKLAAVARSLDAVYWDRWQDLSGALPRLFAGRYGILAALIVACLIAYRRSNSRVFLLSMCGMACITLYLLVYLKLPDRVVECIYLFGLFAALATSDFQKARFPAWITAGVALAFVAALIADLGSRQGHYDEGHRDAAHLIAELKARDGDRFVFWGASSFLSQLPAFGNFKRELSGLEFITLGTTQIAPLVFKERLSRMGIGDLLHEWVARDDIWMLVPAIERLALVEGFYKRRFGLTIKFETIPLGKFYLSRPRLK